MWQINFLNITFKLWSSIRICRICSLWRRNFAKITFKSYTFSKNMPMNEETMKYSTQAVTTYVENNKCAWRRLRLRISNRYTICIKLKSNGYAKYSNTYKDRKFWSLNREKIQCFKKSIRNNGFSEIENVGSKDKNLWTMNEER